MLEQVQKDVAETADPEQAVFLLRYFKTGPGQYGAGDIFRGIRVPALRKLCAKWHNLPLDQTELLLQSSYHEDRLLALLILVNKFAKGDEAGKETIYRLYLKSTRFINNWDLVDCSAEYIVGAYLLERDRATLEQLARSTSLWERRIAIMATFHFIRRGSFDATLRIAEMLLKDKEDLIHKAVGWMLREVGKRDLQRAEAFLLAHHRIMPRTMLRYAIERFPEEKRRMYMRR
jgi:3-methyladenine DNA glycosylase AlkD